MDAVASYRLANGQYVSEFIKAPLDKYVDVMDLDTRLKTAIAIKTPELSVPEPIETLVPHEARFANSLELGVRAAADRRAVEVGHRRPHHAGLDRRAGAREICAGRAAGREEAQRERAS